MHDALRVRGFERVGDLPGEAERGLDVETMRRPGEPGGQGLALDQFEDERRLARAAGDAVDGSDVRVIQRGEQPRLALETGEAIDVRGQLGRQHLERDIAPQLHIARAIHLAHAALADQRPDVEGSQARARQRPGPCRDTGRTRQHLGSDRTARCVQKALGPPRVGQQALDFRAQHRIVAARLVHVGEPRVAHQVERSVAD